MSTPLLGGSLRTPSSMVSDLPPATPVQRARGLDPGLVPTGSGVLGAAAGKGSPGGVAPLQPVLRGALLLVLCIRVVACFWSYGVLLSTQLPPIAYTFFVAVAAGMWHLLFDRSLLGWIRRLHRRVALLVVHAAWQCVSMVVWASALVKFHPLHVLAGEYFEYILVAVCGAVGKRRAQSASVTPPSPLLPTSAPAWPPGLLRLLLRSVLAFCLLVGAHTVFEDTGEGGDRPGSRHPHHDTLGGAMLLLTYCVSEVFRKSYRVWLVKELGSASSVQAASTCLCGPMLLPPMLLFCSVQPKEVAEAASSFGVVVSLCFNGLLAYVLPAWIAGRYPYSADFRGRLVGAGWQCGLACGLGWLLHFVVEYKEDETPVGLWYTVVLFGAFGAQCWALVAAQHALQRQAPASIDPFADYDLGEMDALIPLTDRPSAATLTTPGLRRRLAAAVGAGTFYSLVLLVAGISQGVAAPMRSAFRVAGGLFGTVGVLFATGEQPGKSAHLQGREEALCGLFNVAVGGCLVLHSFM
eukprot:Hpha_TRINITY_DN2878_c0_g1::TRINITY_DN2878_c0_g1_i1::g.171435::m.171435